MEFSLLLSHPLKPSAFRRSFSSIPIPAGKRPIKRNVVCVPSQCSLSTSSEASGERRRVLMGYLLASATAASLVCDAAGAVSTSRRALRGAKIPESEFTTLPNGLKYYDLKVGGGAKAVKGSSRVAVHYVAKRKGITFMTSRQGLGIGGGTVRQKALWI